MSSHRTDRNSRNRLLNLEPQVHPVILVELVGVGDFLHALLLDQINLERQKVLDQWVVDQDRSVEPIDPNEPKGRQSFDRLSEGRPCNSESLAVLIAIYLEEIIWSENFVVFKLPSLDVHQDSNIDGS